MIADLTLKCSSCEREFLFTLEEQSFFQGQGFKSAPRRCKDCRRSRRFEAEGRQDPRHVQRPREHQRHQVSCTSCGVPTRVPFVPDPSRPSFCRSCYDLRRGRR